ncbi:multiple RNA-binding domain-containing protein 1 isoform X2 [Ricinus communis]|uniref:multiple RNA-binding domain-containing protein 1 isoform X2 n=1 Tax=Ricinus communis TaxID=3988 RepID=UPI00201A9988|nr:multiple RNA-binding domain-containing protein 1 isoform X2 [Ricinus communis]
MSRICVKNLPKYVAEDRLREVFSQKGEITDARLMRTKDGKSRQFAFIGFRTELEAEEALKYFNKSYLDTCRITCEIAHKVGDLDIPQPWSKYSKKKEKDVTETAKRNLSLKGTQDEKKTNKKGTEVDDPQLQEFLQVMQPRAKSKLWANDTLVAPTAEKNLKVNQKKAQSKKEGMEKSVVGVDGSNKNSNRDAEKSVNLAHNDIISDTDYFKSRVNKEWSDSESGSSDNADNDNDKDEDYDNEICENSDSIKENPESKEIKKIDQKRQHGIRGVASVEVEEKAPYPNSDGEILDLENPSSDLKDENDEFVETGRLFVRNLPYTATEDELEEHFNRFGNISQVHLVVDKYTKRSKGFAYILYALPESAARALEELDNSIFQGRLMHVMPAKQKNPDKVDDPSRHGSKTFKQHWEEERKASEVNGNTRAWNTLFMRPDTVVENIARRHGVNKSDLLDREADDLAVRIALGESQVIAETKNALTGAGVNILSLEEFAAGKTDGMKRSNHVLLVKNLPYGSSEGELSQMFGKFGSLDKIILPPTKTLALVVFLEPSEARAAFKGLAYKRYKDAPLYLEWAPSDVLNQSLTSKSSEDGNNAVGEHDAKRVMLEQSVEGLSELDIDPDRIESRSLFVKNLNFKTSDESLKKHFSEHMKEGKILSVRIKKHLKNGKNVSMGFGFIEFDAVETATNVCTDLQGIVLDGHALILQLCHAKKDEQVRKNVEKDKSSTKLLVRNVAFEATEKDLRQLFSPFGQIKRLRLPVKFGNHRGFAFVEYVTKQEAQNALQALSSTHLYGRHLVLERAKEGESLEELRARTAAHFSDELSGMHNPAKVSKKRKNMAVLDEGTMKFQRIAS